MGVEDCSEHFTPHWISQHLMAGDSEAIPSTIFADKAMISVSLVEKGVNVAQVFILSHPCRRVRFTAKGSTHVSVLFF